MLFLSPGIVFWLQTPLV